MDAVDDVFKCWREVMCHPNSKLDYKRRSIIKKRLNDGYTVEQLKDAIVGCAKSDWHMGDNQRGTRYDALTLILRDADHVDKFIAISRAKKNTKRQIETFRERDKKSAIIEMQRWIGQKNDEQTIIDEAPQLSIKGAT